MQVCSQRPDFDPRIVAFHSDVCEFRKAEGMTSQQPVFSLEELTGLQPGLGRLMPEIGARAAKLYYAAKAENWPMAGFQLNEIRGLMLMGAFTRPKYEKDLKDFLDGVFTTVKTAILHEDFGEFEAAFNEAVKSANAFHGAYEKPYIVWKVPDSAPPDLDLTPRPKD